MRSAYGARERRISEYPVTIIVDTANVMGARPDGWWRDRAAAAVRLHAELERLAASGRLILPEETVPPEFVMVLEGAAKAASSRLSDPASSDPASSDPASSDPASSDTASPGRVRVVQAPGSGDDAIVALARELPGRRVVVTADRELRERSTAAGAAVLGPSWLLGQLRE